MNKKKLKKIQQDMNGTTDKENKLVDELSSSMESEHESVSEAFNGMAKRIFAKMKEYFEERSETLIKSSLEKSRIKIAADIERVKALIVTVSRDIGSARKFTEGEVEHLKTELDTLVEAFNESYVDHQLKVEGLGESIKSVHDLLDSKIQQGDSHARSEVGILTGKYDILSKELELVKKDGESSSDSFMKVEKRFSDLDVLMKKLSKGLYEYGSQFSVLKGGVLVGQTFGINFENGTNTTIVTSVNSQGFITVTVNATGGSGGITELAATGNVNGSNPTFTFTSKPTYIVSDGAWYKENKGWAWSGLTATMSVPPQSDIFGIA